MTPNEFSDLVWGWAKVAIVLLLVVGIGVPIAKNIFSVGVDDTDTDAWNRSGMRVYTDAKTGVQYLGTRCGGLAPRVDKDGKVVTMVDAR